MFFSLWPSAQSPGCGGLLTTPVAGCKARSLDRQMPEPRPAFWSPDRCRPVGTQAQKSPHALLHTLHHLLKILNSFIFELVFWKWSLTRQQHLEYTQRRYDNTCLSFPDVPYTGGIRHAPWAQVPVDPLGLQWDSKPAHGKLIPSVTDSSESHTFHLD